jgi:anti-sigma factor RsiW
MTPPAARRDWILHAYVDGELEPLERAALEKELSADPEARLAVEAWRRQNQAIKHAFNHVMNEDLPPGIKAVLSAPRRTFLRWALPAAAALVALLAGAYAFYSSLGLGNTAARAIAETALSAHVVYTTEVRHPVEVSAAEKDHLDAWLSKRLGHKIAAPDLSSRGLQLIGGRLLHEDRKPAAQFMYEDARKRRLTVYVAGNPTHRETSMRISGSSGYTTCYWLDEDAAYAVAAELDADELLPLAMFIYELLEQGEG